MCVAGGGEGSIAAPAQQSRLVAERRWRLAMQSQAHPSSIMRDLLACLQQNQVSWKKQAPYNFKCRKAIGPAGATVHDALCSAVWTAAGSCTACILQLCFVPAPWQAMYVQVCMVYFAGRVAVL